ncbi:MAG: hypothetical protein D3926_01375 [Desulfobacteraceae bacterium]|nr:MAG: hypothetical protein D3926_01375 [Desulfobacteraceae bacterium]
MQFIVSGYDGKDEKALERRLAAREAHLDIAKQMYRDKKWLYAAAILDDADKMIGSMIVCEFESKDALEKEWLDHEPYIKGSVWQRVEIHKAMVPPFIYEGS